MCATCAEYSSTQRMDSALKYGRHGHPDLSQTFVAIRDIVFIPLFYRQCPVFGKQDAK